MSFREILDSGKFAVTAEIGPPKGTDIKEMYHHIEVLKGKIDVANVTDNQSAVMRISSLAVCKIVLDNGMEPVLQMTCRDRNRIGLQADLLGASVLGIHNVLCLTGDHVNAGDHKQARSVYDVESVQLLKIVEGMNSGKDMSGNEMKGATHFYAGAVVTPEANPLEKKISQPLSTAINQARLHEAERIEKDVLTRDTNALKSGNWGSVTRHRSLTP